MVRSRDERRNKKERYERSKKEESEEEEFDDSQSTAEQSIDQIEEAILQIREKGKQNNEFDYNRELRKLQDRISDLKGEPRRPITGQIAETNKKKKKKKTEFLESPDEDEELNGDSSRYHSNKTMNHHDGNASRNDNNSDDDESVCRHSDDDEDDEDEDGRIKDIVNKRLTTCMLLALSFDRDNYPKDFYQKLSEADKFDEVTEPITKVEVKILNNLLREKKRHAKKRVEACSRYSK